MSIDVYLEATVNCPHCGGIVPTPKELHSQNITHNVSNMWAKAGVYEALYEAEGKFVTSEYIAIIARGVEAMQANFDDYKKLDSPNGWGKANNALPWLKAWLEKCREYPGAIIRVSA